MPGPLHGVRVIDLTSMVSGPATTMVLADQGADVIKVENPAAGGDHTRVVSKSGEGLAASFLNNNRNKRSITLDLKKPEGLPALLRLIEGADVLVQNFRPGVAERIGVGEAAVRERAPEIIYTSITGFGFTGPYAAKPVYDPLIQALSGLASIQAGSDEDHPRLVRTILPDKLTGAVTSQAITAALYAREKTGQGQAIHLSMLDSVVSFLWGSDMESQTMIDKAIPQQRAQSFIDLIYETADGYISVAVQQDKEWLALTRALDKPEWLEDERFKTATGRHENINARLELTQEALRTRTAAEWLEILEAHGVPCAPVLTRSAMIEHPQIVANGIIFEHEHDFAGHLRQARPPAHFSKTDFELRQPGALLGEHTQEVFLEAGFTDAEIASLRAAGVLGIEQQQAAE
jgi:crotonobetainyl-CoA:carnitine CoA-transferase CaiB-like acyl-CoA transferase